MKLWNLSGLDEIEPQIVESYSDLPKREPVVAKSAPVSLKIVFGVAVFTSVFTVSLRAAPRETLVTIQRSAIAQSIPDEEPPFEESFRNRFDESWTKDMEAKLLEKLVKRRSDRGAKPLHDEVIDSILSNQQEDLASKERLDRATVEGIVRSRKLG